jgi:hypothetical protein
MESTVSSLIAAAEQGDNSAAEELFAALYSELHRLAGRDPYALLIQLDSCHRRIRIRRRHEGLSPTNRRSSALRPRFRLRTAVTR